MKSETIVRLHGEFEKLASVDAQSGVEFWHARDLQEILGYTQWRSFEAVIGKAVTACEKAGEPIENHFARARKMVRIGSSASRDVEDVVLTRYACYLIAQNGDPSKDPIAFAQTYFAVQTRKQENIEQRLAEVERLNARQKLTHSEKELSGIIYDRVGDDRSFARIRSKGDQALFGGRTTRDMKRLLGAGGSRPLADFLPTITIKAKDFANEITNFNIKRGDLRSEPAITTEHVHANQGVRKLLGDRGIKPEQLPAAEDVRKVERRLVSEEKRLPRETKKLPGKEADDKT